MKWTGSAPQHFVVELGMGKEAQVLALGLRRQVAVVGRSGH